MLKVFLTFDVEIWCHGWTDLDARFPIYFKKYVYGPTSSGDFALPITLSILNDHGLTGSFFVEPLFSLRFGHEPLQELLGLVKSAGQDVQLHLHPEWLDESKEPLFSGRRPKRRYLSEFSFDEQRALIARGLDLFRRAGVRSVDAFRAGSFGINLDTFPALLANGISIDTSYNHCQTPVRISNNALLHQPACFAGVLEVPVTVFRDFPGHLRPAHLSACSFRELQRILWEALKLGLESVVIVSHGTELLNQDKSRPDPIVYRRYRRLCRFLEEHRDEFAIQGFHGFTAETSLSRLPPPSSPMVFTLSRTLEQIWRTRYG